MNVDFDVVVVGAGPAGSMSAGELARRGLHVALVDRCSFPRPKVCGDGLTPRAIAALERFGVWPQLVPHAQIVTELQTVDLRTGQRRTGPIPGRVVGSFGYGAVVRRDELDDVLRLRAIADGACFFDGVSIDDIPHDGEGARVVAGRRGGRPWRCNARIVVVADGAGGRLGSGVRGADVPCIDGLALRQYWRLPSRSAALTICIPLRLSRESCAGYGWVFPVGPDMANVGVGLYGTRDGRSLRGSYDSFIARLRSIDHHWRSASPCDVPQGGLLQSGLDPSLMTRDRVVLVGDASGVTNPFTGEGIAQALESGEAAAVAIAEHLGARGELSETYETLIRSKFAETTRNTRHLPWILERGERFVGEFWGAISPPLGLLGRAVRRVSIEEQLNAAACASHGLVEATWGRVRACLEEYPLLAQLVDAVRREEQWTTDEPLRTFWRGLADVPEGLSDVDDVATLLGLMVIACVLASETHDSRTGEGDPGPPSEAVWAINSVALGAVDILVSQAFARVAKLESPASMRCGVAMQMASRDLCNQAAAPWDGEAKYVQVILASLASQFVLAARVCVPKAA